MKTLGFPTTLLALTLHLAAIAPARAEIREIKSYTEAQLPANLADTWVIFDIDNTLLRQDHMIGTHQWGDFIREEEVKKGRKPEQAAAIQHAYFQILQPFVRVLPVEREVYPLLTLLQSRAVPTFALTARGLGVAGTTVEQLTKIRINFQRSFPSLMPKVQDELAQHLFRGVLFAEGQPKGELLRKLVQSARRAPKHIVFFDDRGYNLESIEKSFAGGPVTLTSYRYGAADPFVQSFDPVRARREWEYFKTTGRLP